MADFEVFRSKHNQTHYVAVRSGDQAANARGVRESGNLARFTEIADDGKPHLGFDPAAAKAAIAEHGFYAFAVTVERREHFE
jgi:hypothetical protein